MDRRLLTACVASTLFLTLFNSPGRAQPLSADEAALLENLVVQNEATVQKIESSPIFAEYTWRTTMTLGPAPGPDGADLSGRMIAEGRARYWRHGASFCEDRDLKNTWPDKGEVQDGSNIFLINDRYAVDFRKRLNVLHLYHFDDRNNLYPALKSKVEIYPHPKILEFGARYSTGRTLKEAYEQQVGGGQPGYRWTPIESNVGGNLRYKIVSERTTGEHKRLRQETSMDPHSGFLLSETRTYDKNGEPFYVVQTQFEQISEGIWFPKSATQTRTQDNTTMNVDVQKVALGGPEILQMITLEALDIDRESVLMVEYSNRGMQKTTKGYLDGKWVPFDSLPQERRDSIDDARRNASGG